MTHTKSGPRTERKRERPKMAEKVPWETHLFIVQSRPPFTNSAIIECGRPRIHLILRRARTKPSFLNIYFRTPVVHLVCITCGTDIWALGHDLMICIYTILHYMTGYSIISFFKLCLSFKSKWNENDIKILKVPSSIICSSQELWQVT